MGICRTATALGYSRGGSLTVPMEPHSVTSRSTRPWGSYGTATMEVAHCRRAEVEPRVLAPAMRRLLPCTPSVLGRAQHMARDSACIPRRLLHLQIALGWSIRSLASTGRLQRTFKIPPWRRPATTFSLCLLHFIVKRLEGR